MRKNLLWMLAAILFCGAMTTSCGDDDDDKKGGDQPTTDKSIVGMNVAYRVGFLDGYDTLTDYTITVTYTDENGKDKTETINNNFKKDVKILATKSTVGSFIVKCTPTNSSKEKHDLGVAVAIYAYPVYANGNIVKDSDKSFEDDRQMAFKGRNGSSYKEFTYSTKFQLKDNKVKEIPM